MDTFSFLVTTDNHMGFKEDHHVRRKDSYMAFKEALAIAREHDVDFILLGGDLFHMNRPSSSIEHKCMKIIRQHMNEPSSRGVSFKRIKGNFSHFEKVNHANFEDLNFTVPYPILTIHGNHDDPTGPNAQSVCAKLATCGLINYFGALKPNVKSIIIEPIIFQKGDVKIALYGLGFISDFKLRQAFDAGQVTFIQPPPDTYNVLVIHQNRIPFNEAKYIPDTLLPLNFHLIIRGHEHNAQSPESIPDSEVNGLVYQPGSTVATSISTYEAGPKRVGVFSISTNGDSRDPKKQFKVNYKLIELKCCRRMIMKDVPQRDIYDYIKKRMGTRVTAGDFKRLSKDYIIDCINRLLKIEVETKVWGDENDKMVRFKLPLIRMRIEYTVKGERFDEAEVNSLFHPSRVANRDIVSYRKQKLVKGDDGEPINQTFLDSQDKDDLEFDEFECIDLSEEKRDIDAMIETYFKNLPADERLQALSLSEYTNAVRAANEDGNIISKVLTKKRKEVLDKYNRQLKSNKSGVVDKFMNQETVYRWFVDCFSEDLGAIEISSDSDNNEDKANSRGPQKRPRTKTTPVKSEASVRSIDDQQDDDDSMDVVVCN